MRYAVYIDFILAQQLSNKKWTTRIFELTKSEAVSRELPFVAVIGQTITLLIEGHLVGIHDDGQVPRL